MLVWIFVGLAVLCLCSVLISLKMGFTPTDQRVAKQALGAPIKSDQDHFGESRRSSAVSHEAYVVAAYDYSMESIVSAWRSGKPGSVIAVVGLLGGFFGIFVFIACALFAVGTMPFVFAGLIMIWIIIKGFKPPIKGFLEENKRQSAKASNS
ncbi:hypothetical protein [Vibrio scophthalmi]|uniref:Uncharacterized protein n=2 Tax=Vibrio scophthalmi TaxID=45658 RepID=F9RNS0_9VIBR|nr:hypothetical protein [Vibrio scophthalmi]ANU38209.1 hypothetical protein VSVS05_03171 [Vibrio scophthalmi]EGU36747.1 hypothetical protein VIS19158_18206 [Vibrio scophthalmi LMG 19158]